MKKIKVFIGSLISLLSLTPALAFAAPLDFADVGKLMGSITIFINAVIPFLIALAVVWFIFGVLRFIFNAGSEEGRKQGRDFMIYALIGIVVMLSVWGLVNFVKSSFNFNNATPAAPQVPSSTLIP